MVVHSITRFFETDAKQFTRWDLCYIDMNGEVKLGYKSYYYILGYCLLSGTNMYNLPNSLISTGTVN